MTTTYDYIVIGAGSAGCVIAHRLTENGARALVLEAGGSDKSFLVRRPGALAIVYDQPKLKEQFDWGYKTEPQTHMNDRRMPWTRGKVVGGCSSVNGMLYIRGHRNNYDEWRDVHGCAGWGYDDVLPLFKRSERFEGGANEYHDVKGPLGVTSQEGVSPVSGAFVKAMAAAADVPALDDFNGFEQQCASFYHQTCENRRRMSTAVTFLYPAIERGGVDLEMNAHVNRIVIENGRAVGVAYTGKDGSERIARADREVILSGGAINSPQVLMLSGIGDADHLAEHGIDVVADLPGVGLNLHDHLMVPIRYHATKDAGHTSTALHYLGGMAKDFLFNKGWYGKTFLEAGAFVKSNPDKSEPDIQYFVIPWAYPEPNDDGPEKGTLATEYSFTILTGMIYPESRGSIRLASADPRATPLIDPNYLSDDRDMQVLLRGLEISRQAARTKPLADYLIEERTPGADKSSEEEMRAHVRLFGKTIYHPVGTCKMGVDEMSVVNPQLEVRGVEGLRVADASIMPKIVGGNTNAPAIMIGEKCADLVLGDA